MATKEINLGSVRGPQGPGATVQVGSVTTGQPGTDAAVVNSGTSTDAILHFTIPRGEQGAQGLPTTVNGKSGQSITLTAQDVGAMPQSGGVYSAEEVNTGKVWIDGKPIYRRIFQITAPYPTGTSSVYAPYESFENISDFVGVTGWRESPTEEGGIVMLPHALNGSEYHIQAIKGAGRGVEVFHTTLASGAAPSGEYSWYFVVEYTKTTD